MAQVIQFPGAGAKAPAVIVPGHTAPAIAEVIAFPDVRALAKHKKARVLNIPRHTDRKRKAALVGEARARQKRFGERLRVVRTFLGLSRGEAASAAGVALSSWSNYETGGREMGTIRVMAFVHHQTVALRSLLLTWLLEDGDPNAKELDIIKYCRDSEIWTDEIHRAVAAICRPV